MNRARVKKLEKMMASEKVDNSVYKVYFYRDMPTGCELEKCYAFLNELWNVEVKPVDEREPPYVEGCHLHIVLDFLRAHIRPLERIEIECVV